MLLVSPPTFYYESFRNRKRKSRRHKACTLAARLVSSWSALLCRMAAQLSPVHSQMRLKVVDHSPLFPKYSSLQTTFSLYSVPVFPLGSDIYH